MSPTSAPRPIGAAGPALFRYLGPLDISDQAEAVATRYRLVVVNPTAAGRALRDAVKAVDPAVRVLAYQDLSSTRSYDVNPATGADRPDLVTGVGFAESEREHPEWFARDSSGRRLEWDGFDDHWQMAVWDAGYQDRWVANVLRRVREQGWDGVEADNANPGLAYNGSARLGAGADAGSPERGIRELVAKAGAALTSRGLLFSPNVAQARFLHEQRWWAQLGRWGAASEERFLQLCDPPQDCYNVADPADSASYDAQARQLREVRFPLVTTSGAADDTKAFRYGYAGFLVHGAGRGVFAYALPERSPGGPPDAAALRPELTWVPGPSLSDSAVSGPVRWRAFSRVFAAHNVQRAGSAAVVLPAGPWVDAEGVRMTGRQVLDPQQSLVLRRP